VGDLAQRAQQPLDVPDAVLEQVRQSGGAVAEQLEGVGLVGALDRITTSVSAWLALMA
jgi:hypothetical protein